MDNEEKYKKLIRAIKILREIKPRDESLEKWIKDYVPYLAESEDEKIKKWLLSLVEGLPDKGLIFSSYDIEKEEVFAWIEKQGEPSIKWNKNTEGNKPQVNHSVLMKTTYGIAEGEWDGECWLQYRWSSRMKDNNILSWIELSDLSKERENNF